MTRAKTTATPPANPPPESQQAGQQEPSIVEELQGMLGELKGETGAEMNVYRQDPPGPAGKFQPSTWIFDGKPEDFENGVGALFARLRDEYGGGTFRISIRVGKKQLVNRVVSIYQRPEPPAAPTLLVPTPPPAPAGPDLGTAIAQLGNTLQQSLQGQMLEICKLMLTHKGGGGSGMSFDNAIALANLLKGDKQDPLSLIDKLLGVQERLGVSPAPRDTPGDANAFSVMAEGLRQLPAFIEMLRASQANPQPLAPPGAAPRPTSALAAPGGAAAPSPATVRSSPPDAAIHPGPSPAPASTADTPQAQLVAALQLLLPIVLNAAEKGRDPSTYAAMLLDAVDDDGAVLEFANEPTAVMLLVQMAPMLAPHVAWLEGLRSAILAAFEDADAPPPPAAPAPQPIPPAH